MRISSIEQFGKYRKALDHVFQHSEFRNKLNQGFESKDRSVLFCVAKDLLQDTAEAWIAINKREPSTHGLISYIEFWGVLQAHFVQQDALNEMMLAISGAELNSKITQHSFWRDFREARNKLAGHPANKGSKQKGHFRTSIARIAISYQGCYAEEWNSVSQTYERKFVDTKKLIDNYYRIAAIAIYTCYRALRRKLQYKPTWRNGRIWEDHGEPITVNALPTWMTS